MSTNSLNNKLDELKNAVSSLTTRPLTNNNYEQVRKKANKITGRVPHTNGNILKYLKREVNNLSRRHSPKSSIKHERPKIDDHNNFAVISENNNNNDYGIQRSSKKIIISSKKLGRKPIGSSRLRKSISRVRKSSRKYRLKSSKQMFIYFDGKKCNINNDGITNITVLSHPGKTVSNAKVISFQDKNYPYKNYIIKEFNDEFNKIDSNDYNAIFREANIYNCMNMLVKFGITPFVITLDKIVTCDKIPSRQFYLINETKTNNEISSDVASFMKNTRRNFHSNKYYEIFINIIFQVIYTLNCFNKINLKHNDLHLHNILLFIHKNNLNDSDNWEYIYNNKIIYNSRGDEILLPDLGFNSRIFDFGNSSKLSAETRIDKLNKDYLINLDQSILFHKIFFSDIKNHKLDLFKFIATIFDYTYENYKTKQLRHLEHVLYLISKFIKIDMSFESFQVALKQYIDFAPISTPDMLKVLMFINIFTQGYYIKLSPEEYDTITTKMANKNYDEYDYEPFNLRDPPESRKIKIIHRNIPKSKVPSLNMIKMHFHLSREGQTLEADEVMFPEECLDIIVSEINNYYSTSGSARDISKEETLDTWNINNLFHSQK
jgi:hypothetical protein